MSEPGAQRATSGRALAILAAAGVPIIVAVALFVKVPKVTDFVVLGVCVLVIAALGIRYRGGRNQ